MEMAKWAFSYPRNDHDSLHTHSEVRSGEVWSWEVESRTVPEGVMKGFAEVKQVIRCERTIISKSTGEITRETDYALTNLPAPAADLYCYWRGHWEIENRSHHKRDTIFGEDILYAAIGKRFSGCCSTVGEAVVGCTWVSSGTSMKV